MHLRVVGSRRSYIPGPSASEDEQRTRVWRCCAPALLNLGRTTLPEVAEVYRGLEVLEQHQRPHPRWINDSADPGDRPPPAELDLNADTRGRARTCSVICYRDAAAQDGRFRIPTRAVCDLGAHRAAAYATSLEVTYPGLRHPLRVDQLDYFAARRRADRNRWRRREDALLAAAGVAADHGAFEPAASRWSRTSASSGGGRQRSRAWCRPLTVTAWRPYVSVSTTPL